MTFNSLLEAESDTTAVTTGDRKSDDGEVCSDDVPDESDVN